MRVLFDMVHPADVLFYERPIRMLQAEGAACRILSRHKDITCDLLDRLGFEHRPISRMGKGMIALGSELLVRDWRVWQEARSFRPDVMTGFGGVAISHVTALTRIPSVAFYDSDHAKLQIGLTVPFVTEWHVPPNWMGAEAKGRTIHVNSYKELSRLHPDHFTPDDQIARKAGWTTDRPNVFIRVVAWQAAHDAGMDGITDDRLRDVVAHLQAKGCTVHISTERPLPDDLADYHYKGDVLDVHHLLGKCSLYVGESATMAAEAAVLGVPGVCTVDVALGYIEEMTGSGMLTPCPDLGQLEAMIDQALGLSEQQIVAAHQHMMENKVDMAVHVVTALKRAAKQGI
ncbi:MAG: hypothetical protein Alpg2KO_27280 [Alphaproteobacteria bacterium]